MRVLFYTALQALHREGWRALSLRAFLEVLRDDIAAQKDAVILWLPVFLAMGIGLYFASPFEPPVVLGGAVWLLSAVVFFFLFPVRQNSAALMGGWLLLCFTLCVATGFMAAQLRLLAVKEPLLEKEIGPVMVEGRVADIDLLEPGMGSRMVLEDVAIEKRSPDQTPHRVRLKVHDDRGLAVGTRVRVLAHLNPPSAPVAPGAFDFQRYAYFQKIGAFGFAFEAPEVIGAPERNGFWAAVDRLRQSIAGRIEAHMPYPQAAFAMALMTGERSAIAEDDWEAIRAAGLAHMLAISGLHIGIVAGMMFFFSRLVMAAWPRLALYHPIKKYAAVFAFAGALVYTILAGASVSTVRALFMTGVVLFAIIVDRMPFSLRTVALAALIILLLKPESLFSAGFQMSFAAVTALIFFYETVKPWWSGMYRGGAWPRRTGMYFAGVILTTLVAGSAVAPFSLFHFQQYPMYDIPANILAGPLMAFLIMPSVLLTFFTMPLGLEGLSLTPLDWGISGLLYIARDVAALPNATWNPPGWPASALLFIVLGALWLMLWRGRLRFMGGAFFVFSMLVIFNYNQPDIIVSSSSKLIALRDDDAHMHLSSKVYDRFSAENWARLYGVAEEDILKFPREGREGAFTCGELGCRTVVKGRRVAFSFHPDSQPADCAWAHVLIAQDPVRDRKCRAGIVLDVYDFYRDGAHALWLEERTGGSVRVESVASMRGQRPWIVSHRR